MMDPETPKTQVLVEPDVERKLRALDETLEELLKGKSQIVPDTPGRDVQIWPIRTLPPKKGLSTREGQARLLHDLGSIELQAMELGVRTLCEFPQAPREFRERLAEITREEGRHLQLCVEGLSELGFPWGSFPTHLGLWTATSSEDTLLDRVLIVHRYLEGSGLDASNTILNRLSGVEAHSCRRVVKVIEHDEVAHVQFGSEWYKRLARLESLDPDEDFVKRLNALLHRLPRRKEPIHRERRRVCGFSDIEIQALEEVRGHWR